MSLRIAESWGLSQPFQAAMAEQAKTVPCTEMSALGRALWYGGRVATYAALAREAAAESGARAMLLHAGLEDAVLDAMWRALEPPDGAGVSVETVPAAQSG